MWLGGEGGYLGVVVDKMWKSDKCTRTQIVSNSDTPELVLSEYDVNWHVYLISDNTASVTSTLSIILSQYAVRCFNVHIPLQLTNQLPTKSLYLLCSYASVKVYTKESG